MILLDIITNDVIRRDSSIDSESLRLSLFNII